MVPLAIPLRLRHAVTAHRPSRLRSSPHAARRWAAAAAWAVLIGVLLWTSGPETPPSWTWVARFEEAGGDKLVHAVLFGVQAWLLLRGRPGDLRPGWLVAGVGAAILFGIVTELGQLAVPGRDAGVGDALADAVGAAVGAGYYRWRAGHG